MNHVKTTQTTQTKQVTLKDLFKGSSDVTKHNKAVEKTKTLQELLKDI